MKSKAGKKFDAYIVLDADCKTSFEFDNKSQKIMTDITISQKEIAPLIHTIRDKQVILDADLAMLYQVETKALNRVVKRNQNRFPETFAFSLANRK